MTNSNHLCQELSGNCWNSGPTNGLGTVSQQSHSVNSHSPPAVNQQMASSWDAVYWGAVLHFYPKFWCMLCVAFFFILFLFAPECEITSHNFQFVTSKNNLRPDGILSLNKNTHLIAEEHISSGMLLRCNIRSFLDRRLSFFLQKM